MVASYELIRNLRIIVIIAVVLGVIDAFAFPIYGFNTGGTPWPRDS